MKADTRQEVAAPSLASQLVTVHGGAVPEESRRPDFTGVANPSGNKRIRFDDQKNRYEIMYAVKDGDEMVMRRSVKGLYVKTHSRGVKRTPEQLEEAMDKAHKEARRLWNELDRSGQDRYV